MSVKFIKNSSQTGFAPLTFPNINGAAAAAASTSGVSAFSYPSTANVQTSSTQFTGFGEKNLTDEIQIEPILENARAEAAALIAKAEADAAMIQQAAAEKGLAEARRTVESEIAIQVEETRAQLFETIKTISSLYNEIAKRAENDLVTLACSIAQKIIGREVAVEREIALALTRVTLQRLHSRAIAAVHLHPDDYAYVSAHQEQLDFHGTLELVEDRSISLGGCLVRTETGDLDARIEQQFDEVSRGLLGS